MREQTPEDQVPEEHPPWDGLLVRNDEYGTVPAVSKAPKALALSDNPKVRWAQMHLNLVWWIAFLLRSVLLVGFAYLSPSGEDTVGGAAELPPEYWWYFLGVVPWVLMLLVTIWVIHRKGRSYLWVLLSIVVPFLSSKRVKVDDNSSR